MKGICFAAICGCFVTGTAAHAQDSSPAPRFDFGLQALPKPTIGSFLPEHPRGIEAVWLIVTPDRVHFVKPEKKISEVARNLPRGQFLIGCRTAHVDARSENGVSEFILECDEAVMVGGRSKGKVLEVRNLTIPIDGTDQPESIPIFETSGSRGRTASPVRLTVEAASLRYSTREQKFEFHGNESAPLKLATNGDSSVCEIQCPQGAATLRILKDKYLLEGVFSGVMIQSISE